MLYNEADEKAEKFIITQNLLLKFLDTKMQENAYKIMEEYARQNGEEPPLRFMLQELDVLETQEGQHFTGQTAMQKFNPLEVTKVAGLNLYTNQTDEVSSHSLFTRKGVGSQPPPAGTRYENNRQRSYSGNNRDEYRRGQGRSFSQYQLHTSPSRDYNHEGANNNRRDGSYSRYNRRSRYNQSRDNP